MVAKEGLFPGLIVSGPISIPTFWFAGSMSADFGAGDNPSRMILSTVQSVENLFPPAPEGAAFEDVSFPFENLRWRWM